MKWVDVLKGILARPVVAGQRIVPILWGLPGVGKTARVKEIARELGAHLEVVILSIRDATEVAGLPMKAQDGSIKIAPSSWAMRAAEAARKGRRVVVFFDELTTVPRAVQAAALRILLEGVVGELELPESVAFVAAANPPDVAAGGWDLEPPMANRLLHLHVKPDVEEWVRWAQGQGPTFALVAAFVRRRPDLLLDFPKERSRRGEAWPSPRSWAALAAAMEALGTRDPDDLVEVAHGAVGPGAASEFLTWLEQVDLPEPAEVLERPHEIPLPAREDAVFALTLGAVHLAGKRGTAEAVEAVAAFLARVYRAGYADIAAAGGSELVPAVKELLNRGELRDIPAFYGELSPELLTAFAALK